MSHLQCNLHTFFFIWSSSSEGFLPLLLVIGLHSRKTLEVSFSLVLVVLAGVTRSTISTSAAFCIILQRRHEGLQLITGALPVTQGSVHQCRWHNMFVRRLVLWAWVKARVSVGELLTHHYGSLKDPMNCEHTHINPHLNSSLHHYPLHQTGCAFLWFRGSWVIGKITWSAGVPQVH